MSTRKNQFNESQANLSAMEKQCKLDDPQADLSECMSDIMIRYESMFHDYLDMLSNTHDAICNDILPLIERFTSTSNGDSAINSSLKDSKYDDEKNTIITIHRKFTSDVLPFYQFIGQMASDMEADTNQLIRLYDSLHQKSAEEKDEKNDSVDDSDI